MSLKLYELSEAYKTLWNMVDGMIGGWDIDPESVGQFTGLRDSKRTEEYPDGQEIYEGDIVHCKMISANRTHYLDDYIATVEDDICNPCFALKQANGNVEYDFIKCGLMELEVIGNIHSNPSLLEVQP